MKCIAVRLKCYLQVALFNLAVPKGAKVLYLLMD